MIVLLIISFALGLTATGFTLYSVHVSNIMKGFKLLTMNSEKGKKLVDSYPKWQLIGKISTAVLLISIVLMVFALFKLLKRFMVAMKENKKARAEAMLVAVAGAGYNGQVEQPGQYAVQVYDPYQAAMYMQQQNGQQVYQQAYAQQPNGQQVYQQAYAQQPNGQQVYQQAYEQQPNGQQVYQQAYAQQPNGQQVYQQAYVQQPNGQQVYQQAYVQQPNGQQVYQQAYVQQPNEQQPYDQYQAGVYVQNGYMQQQAYGQNNNETQLPYGQNQNV